MKYLFLSLLFLTTLTAQPIHPTKQRPVKATVTGSQLNIRVKPNTTSTILSQAFRNHVLKVVAIKDKWAQVEVPRSAQVWVQTKDLKNGVVQKNDTPLYAGPAIQYAQVGELAKGETVKKILGSEQWWQITTARKMYAWVSAEYLKFPTQEAKKVEPINQVPGVTNELKDGVEALLEDHKELEPKKVVSKSAQNNLRGLVTPLKKPLTNLATHALMIKIGDEYHTTCYLRSDVIKLERWAGKSVIINGKNELVLGWQRPIIVVTSIREQKTKKSRFK
jgi:uncharacterized protein YgiM (DUF1202 family)